MQRLVLVGLMVLLLAAGCGDDGDSAALDPGDVESCGELAQIQMTVFQAAVDVYAGRSVEEMEGISRERFRELLGSAADLGEEVQARAAALGCTDAEFSEFLCDRADDFRVDGPAASRYLTSVLQANSCS